MLVHETAITTSENITILFSGELKFSTLKCLYQATVRKAQSANKRFHFPKKSIQLFSHNPQSTYCRISVIHASHCSLRMDQSTANASFFCNWNLPSSIFASCELCEQSQSTTKLPKTKEKQGRIARQANGLTFHATILMVLFLFLRFYFCSFSASTGNGYSHGTVNSEHRTWTRD